ncbi:MAG: nucleoside triphosphate pyrophosphatase [Candidatus Stygibacter australis]|nr:nucleoside triphosphate pyrophosphatase [Candidatus Stygibacter australis]MDP8322518.1 nucleoside triphosphate pyrophosphatase [Candidatus Stygibacter australis]
MLHQILANKRIVLASASPRRKVIFEMLKINALVFPAMVEEDSECISPHHLVMEHAGKKAEFVAAKMPADTIVVGADTIVYLDNIVLGKPADKYEAYEHLSRLSGNKHNVYTGIAVCYKNTTMTGYARSLVEFNLLTREEIEEYIKTGEPMDKAGAYGIQGYGSQFIKKITGCYFNVMGFPVSTFYKLIKELIIT